MVLRVCRHCSKDVVYTTRLTLITILWVALYSPHLTNRETEAQPVKQIGSSPSMKVWQSGDSWVCALSLYPIFCLSKQRQEGNLPVDSGLQEGWGSIVTGIVMTFFISLQKSSDNGKRLNAIIFLLPPLLKKSRHQKAKVQINGRKKKKKEKPQTGTVQEPMPHRVQNSSLETATLPWAACGFTDYLYS